MAAEVIDISREATAVLTNDSTVKMPSNYYVYTHGCEHIWPNKFFFQWVVMKVETHNCPKSWEKVTVNSHTWVGHLYHLSPVSLKENHSKGIRNYVIGKILEREL